MKITRWAPQVRVTYDYYPYGLTWEDPRLPSSPESVHDHCYQDKEFQWAEFTTGHGLALHDFHARMYDGATGRWLVPDPAAQFANPYLAMGNNPVVSMDPDGRFIFTAATLIAAPFTGGASLSLLPMAIGADVGMWQGGSMANGSMDPTDWEFDSNTFKYMAAGAVVGTISATASFAISTSGLVGANTLAIMAGSFTNSLGSALYTGFQTDVSMSFGFGSINVSNGDLGYLGKKGNSVGQNIGYGFGLIANINDIMAGFKPQSVDLKTENDHNWTHPKSNGKVIEKDIISHSQLSKDGKTLVDFGPGKGGATNNYENGVLSDGLSVGNKACKVHGVNLERIKAYKSYLDNNATDQYRLLTNNCVRHTSRALNMSGMINVGIHPYILHAQVYLRSIGVRPANFSYFIQN
jgi:RHS repeat-associated protein